MEVLSVRDYRNNLSASFDRAAEGERVLIRRKNALYALVSVGSELTSINYTWEEHEYTFQNSDQVTTSWMQVKQMESGEIPTKSAMAFIDEL